MKTPREILLDRHQAATPQLDELRQSFIAELSGPTAELAVQRRSLMESLGQWFALPKPALAGLAFVWLVIIMLNLASRDSAVVPASAPAQMARNQNEIMQDLRAQKRLFAELVGTLKDPEAEAPRFVPRPRGELQTPYHYA